MKAIIPSVTPCKYNRAKLQNQHHRGNSRPAKIPPRMIIFLFYLHSWLFVHVIIDYRIVSIPTVFCPARALTTMVVRYTNGENARVRNSATLQIVLFPVLAML